MSQCIIKARDGIQADLEAGMCQEENQTGAEQGLDVTSSVSCGMEKKSTRKLKIDTNVERWLIIISFQG